MCKCRNLIEQNIKGIITGSVVRKFWLPYFTVTELIIILCHLYQKKRKLKAA